MGYQQYIKLPESQFRRVSGVKFKTYFKMVQIIDDIEKNENPMGKGRPKKLCSKDRVLLTLMYLLEYRTQLQCGLSFGVCEATAGNAIRDIEDKLIKCGAFSLPGKKALYDLEYNVESILIDATETRIERPKKSRVSFIQERKNTIA